MPVYKVVSVEVLNAIREELESMIRDFSRCVSYSDIALFELKLSEYLQMWFYYLEYNDCGLYNVKISENMFKPAQQVKKNRKTKFTVFSEDEGHHIVNLKKTGDIIRYELARKNGMLTTIKTILLSDLTLRILDKTRMNSYLQQSFADNTVAHAIFEVEKHDLIVEKLEDILSKRCLSENDSKPLCDIIESTINDTGCSRGIVLEALFSILKDEYVIGENK